MREHEVPTHVQAEDRVLLWLTFPQVAALLAVCGVAYGVWRYAPVGPSEIRIGLAVAVALVGAAATVGRVGDRRLPLAVADLLRYALMPRRYEGPPSDLARAEPPAPAHDAEGPLRVLTSRVKTLGRRARAYRTLRKRRRRSRSNPHRPQSWRRMWRKRRKPVHLVLAVTALIAVTIAGTQPAFADGPPVGGEGDGLDGIEFAPPEQVPGRRLFVEDIEVFDDYGRVTLRAASDLDVRIRGYGDPDDARLLYYARSSIGQGERRTYEVPLVGHHPSLVFAWRDPAGFSGALRLRGDHVPQPLPWMDGELCSLRVRSVRWTEGELSGVVSSHCVSSISHAVEIEMTTGHRLHTVTALVDAPVTSLGGSLDVWVPGVGTVTVPFVPDANVVFRVTVPDGEGLHRLSITANVEAHLRAPRPPLVRLTHHEERVEERAETVPFTCPGVSRVVSKTVTVTHPDGSTSSETVSATLRIPPALVESEHTFEILHPEHVRAEILQRGALARTVTETLVMGLSIRSDAPFEPLDLPDPPEPVKSEQTPLSEWDFGS